MIGSWRKRCVLLALLLGASSTEASAQSSPDTYRSPTPAEEQAGVEWLAAHGHPLSGSRPTERELAPIIARLSGARIIGLGEATHGTHEDQALKAALIEGLIKAGAVDTIAVEANRSAVAGFDRYVHGGSEDLDATVRSDSFFRVWRTDEFANLLKWVRSWNSHSARKVRMVGIDIQDGQRDAEEALAYVAANDPATATSIRSRLAPRPPASAGHHAMNFMRWSMSAPKAQFASSHDAVLDLCKWYDRQANKHGNDQTFQAGRDAAQGACQGFATAAPFNNSDPSKLTPEDWQRRDTFMAANLLASANGGHRVALWAHNGHVIADVPASIRQQGFMSLGMRVHDAIGPAYRTLGTTYSNATILVTQKTAADANTLFPPEDDRPIALTNDGAATTGAEFNRAAPKTATVFWVDLDDAATAPSMSGWRQRAVYKGEVGWLFDPADWQKGPAAESATPIGSGFDILVWFRKMTPSHRWAGEFKS